MTKLKDVKIIAIIITFLTIIFKAYQFGKKSVKDKLLKEKLKDYEKSKEIDNLIDSATDDELDNLL
jgi:FtsZ-interacting cell division protein ZipA